MEHMQQTGPRRYDAPRLKVYGTVKDLTLSLTTSGKNDATQGQNNLKT